MNVRAASICEVSISCQDANDIALSGGCATNNPTDWVLNASILSGLGGGTQTCRYTMTNPDRFNDIAVALKIPRVTCLSIP